MRTLYLDCGMGASGDMLMAALSALTPEGGRIGGWRPWACPACASGWSRPRAAA